ncbi:hypothetical protein EDC96DRAFT_258294 [Choanephora cucurbitarum]|nr:hypothetical protein EDC96DRAFT_258294 [Choanephora cucurbitarum]
MDGNMQLKRRAAGREELPTERIFSLSSGELSLWGTKEEVDRADDMAKALKKDEVDCSVDISAGNSFKAANNNNRNNSTGRYDQTDVFSLSCARHGVPERMYDIYGGEGHKYALACVGHMIKSNPNKKFGIMYDIACLVRKGLENCYPTLKNDPWYGVTAFHAYAHTMACQVNCNPKYIPNSGYTDGEGCERFWSYLDGLVSMTRSMSSRNRLLAITDSVDHFTYQKMLELPEQIKNKKKIVKNYLKKTKKQNMEEQWQSAKELLSLSLTEKYFRSLKKKLRSQLLTKDQHQHLVNIKKLEYIECIDTTSKIISKEKQKITGTFGILRFQRGDLSQDDDNELTAAINAEVTDFLIILIKKYVFALALKEKQLNGSGKIGTKKAVRLITAIKSITTNATIIIEKLNEHLTKNCSEEDKALYSLDSFATAIKKYSKEEANGMTNEILAWHQARRAREELRFLNDEDEQFVRNLEQKLKAVKIAIEANTFGQAVFLEQEYRRLLAIKERAESFLETPFLVNCADEVVTDGGKSIVVEEVGEVEEVEEDVEENRITMLVKAIQ